MKDDYKILFEPMQIGQVEVKNKFFMAPMATIVQTDQDYCYTAQSTDYYVERAKGGVGLIITGANWVENSVEPHVPCSFPCPTKLPIKYEHQAKEMTDRCHAFGAKIFLQLTAGLGRSALPNFVAPKDMIAPSTTTNRWLPNVTCRELKTEEIEEIVKQFGKAAHIAKSSGFDGVEIHAVHEGYLLDCFTMTLFNQRTDKYGGDLKGRLRFACEIVQEIKKTCGKDFPVVLRFSIKSYIKALRQGAVPGEEFKELGRDIEEAKLAIPILEEAGYDAFDADAGTYDSWYWAHPPMYFNKGMYLPLVKEVRDAFTKPVLTAGRMDHLDMAADAVKSGLIDGVGLGRPLLTDPDYCNKVRAGKEKEIRPCLGCHDGCFGRLLQSGLGSCAVNPECGRESTVGIQKADEKKTVAVVGGGPAGMEAARVSALRGHKVVLFEAKEQLGGALLIAGVPDFKEDDRDLIAWYTHELNRLGVEVRLGTPATKELIAELHPDTVFVAEGSRPVIPRIDGVDHAVLAQDILLGNTEAKENITVIGGGLVGCELSLHLAQNGKHVTIIEALPDILKSGAPIPPMNEWMLRDLLAFNHVDIITGACVKSISDAGVSYEKDGTEQHVNADQTVLAIGYRSDKTLYEELKYDYAQIYNLGDSREVRNIRGAVWDAYEVARCL